MPGCFWLHLDAGWTMPWFSNRRIIGLAMLAGMVLYLPAGAVGESERLNRFALSTGCTPLTLRVILNDELEALGIDRRAVNDLVTGYLHSAQLYSTRSKALVTVTLQVVGEAFLMRLAFAKIVVDPVTKTAGPATTWRLEHLGLHAGDTGALLDDLGGVIRNFMKAYLNVNREACRQQP